MVNHLDQSGARQEEKTVGTNGRPEKPFNLRFIEVGSQLSLELMNTTDQTLRSVEVLTVFLKDEESLGRGPSQAHIRFETLNSIQPLERAVLPHRTWVNGKPANLNQDQLERLTDISGSAKPYVLDISWDNAEGKRRFQRIPVGH
jgi:hypothetical protein